ncbi:hypothetical protein BJ165DRAFT_1516463 [Panaeolus papilionaceus]|nr:hypothetical protein BJ165DRAFT_1516463 [Panaeolus papilionaceus]
MESLLKNLHLDDIKKSDKQAGHAATPPPSAAPGGVGGLLGKLGGALDAHLNQGQPTQAAHHAPPQQAVKGEGLFDKISDALGGHHSTPAPPPPAPKKEGVDAVFDKLGGILGGSKPTAAAPPPEPKKQGVEGLFDKISDKITGKDEPPPPPPSFIQKVSEVVIKKDDKIVEKPSSLGDKLNNALGGGAKGEAKEGRLDKAIDLVQEYVLKEGPQHHESALEQAKDSKIADTIRNTLGLEKKN